MKYFTFFWFIINISLILSILIRDSDDQSLQETLSLFLVLDNFKEIRSNLDKLIWILILMYFILGFMYSPKLLF